MDIKPKQLISDETEKGPRTIREIVYQNNLPPKGPNLPAERVESIIEEIERFMETKIKPLLPKHFH